MRSSGVLNAYTYILGIGDRHCDNLLLDFRDMSLIAIDFGYTLNFSVSVLAIPELIPFRWTPIMSYLELPVVKTRGVMEQMLARSLEQALEHRELILGFLQIYVTEPLDDERRQPQSDLLMTVEAKLRGDDPKLILLNDLRKSMHRYVRDAAAGSEMPLVEAINNACVGIDIPSKLLGLAKNGNILGRTWIGWAPFA